MSDRIGHFAANPEVYLCEQDAGINGPKTNHIDLWIHSGKICNEQLATMWGRVLLIGPSTFLSLVDRLNGFFPGHQVHRIENTNSDRDVYNLLERFPPHLNFMIEEESRGQNGLRCLGIPVGVKFVCLNVRDSAYLDKMYPEKDWKYHNYRDSTIDNFLLVAKELSARGYYVIRMGVEVNGALPSTDQKIIDYATNGMRSDFMDIYLGARCDFSISTGTGFDAIPFIFRRPISYVNFVPIAYLPTSSTNFIGIVKKHWLKSEKRFMTFREIFCSGAGFFVNSKQFEEIGIELVENTPEEIAAAVLEMECRLRGTWETTQEDEELQKRFWEIFPKSSVSPIDYRPLHGEIRSKIGAEFLRKYREWLI